MNYTQRWLLKDLMSLVEEESGDGIGISYCSSAEQEERSAALPVNPHFSIQSHIISIFPTVLTTTKSVRHLGFCSKILLQKATRYLLQHP